MKKHSLTPRTVESVKTVALAALVLASVLLSTLLWTGTPGQVAIDRPTFFSNPLYGRRQAAGDFVVPRSIGIWTSANELFRLGGTSVAAGQIITALRQSRFVSGALQKGTAGNNSAIPASGPYLVLNYGGLLQDGSLWSLAMPIQGHLPSVPVSGPVYVVPKPKTATCVISFATVGGVYRAVLEHVPQLLFTDMTPNNQAIPYAQIPVNQTLLHLPYAGIMMQVDTWTLAEPISSHIIDSYFVDPSLIQNIRGPARSTFYTDGTRGVRVQDGPFGNVLTYQSPSGSLGGFNQSMAEALLTVVPFIDSHGGFVGSDVLQKMSVSPSSSEVNLQFSDMINGWPLFGSLDRITVRLQYGGVVRLNRNLPYLGMELSQVRQRILSGTQLVAVVGEKTLRQVTDITLGYGTIASNQLTVECVPVYRLEFRGRPSLYVDARTGKPFLGSGM
ncbi:MAG: two-component system activity regulator YycH [Bacilli bacterium]